MIRNATLTILGLWQYDHTVLDGLQVPQGISKETVSDNLLMECAELEAVYPDPAFMKQAVTSWSAMMAPIWQELYDTTQYEYNPIWNKDGTITETVTRGLETTGRMTRDRDLTDTTARNLGTTDTTTRDLDTTDNGTITGTSEEINQTKGFNSTTWADSTKKSGTTSSTTAATGSEDETVSKTGSENETINKTGSDDETVNQTGAEDETTTLSRRETGNIGVTTTQQMIREQREIVELNMVKRIIDDFKMRFCILVY